jgi:hypothetical protein
MLLTRRSARRRAALLALVSLFVACKPERTLDVSSTIYGSAGSLRSVLQLANQRGNGTVRIRIPSGTYDLSSCGADDSNRSGDLDITTKASVTLEAVAGAVVIHQTCETERVLDNHGTGLLTLIGITLTGGSVEGTSRTDSANGGGLRAR